VSTVAGSWDDGLKDGPIASATFTYPWGITVDQHGDIYVTDSDKIRKISTDGIYLILFLLVRFLFLIFNYYLFVCLY
jgi:hypothetical protein